MSREEKRKKVTRCGGAQELKGVLCRKITSLCELWYGLWIKLCKSFKCYADFICVLVSVGTYIVVGIVHGV